MSETAILWLFGTVITLQTLATAALASRLWEHVVKCRDVTAALSKAEAKIEHLERNVQGLRDWKHEIVDPYIPRALDEHERRINRLDQKMDDR